MMEDEALKDTRGSALVTGGGKRLGRAVALRLAAKGWHVAIHYNSSRDAAHEVAEAVQSHGGKAATIEADLADPAAAGSVIERASEAIGPIALLVNSASLHGKDSLQSMTMASWQRLIDINLTSQVMVMQAFARQPDLPSNPVIINLLDTQNAAPSPAFFSYFVAKIGLEGATRLAALELAPAIRVNGIAPGLVLPSAGQTEARFEARQDQMPLGRGLGEQDIADAVLYLAEARHVTGEILHIDSGQRLMGPGNSELAPAHLLNSAKRE